MELIEKIKQWVIVALFSDDVLMGIFTLKGGSALNVIYGYSERLSIDVDLSMERTEITEDELSTRIQSVLVTTFNEQGYRVFDVKLSQRPPILSEDMKSFWGGYRAEFKISKKEKYELLKKDIDSLRRQAEVVGPNQQRTFIIDISAHEWCSGKKIHRLDGLQIYVYSPEMLVFEKLRAICQQMEEYADCVSSPSRSARARDFYDIFIILSRHAIDFSDPENQSMLIAIFNAKRVPLSFIGLISKYREYHRPDYESVKNTVKPGVDLQDFDFYFDFVIEQCRVLQPLWEK